MVVPKRIGNMGIPFTILIDNEGTVKHINTGFAEKNAHEFVERLEHALQAVLGIDSSGTSN